MNRKILAVALLLGGLLVGSAFASLNAGNNDNYISLMQTNTSAKQVIIKVNEYGRVYLDLHYYPPTPVDISFLGIDNNSVQTQHLYLVGFDVSIGGGYNSSLIYIVYYGDVRTDQTYVTHAQTIKDEIVTKLGYTITSSTNMVAYLNQTDIGQTTVFAWSFEFANSDSEIRNNLYTLFNGLLSDPFHQFIKTPNNVLELLTVLIVANSNPSTEFTIWYSASFSDSLYSFTGNGTHTFSLNQVLGLSTSVTGTSYWVTIVLPAGAVVDPTTYSGPQSSNNVFYQNTVFIEVPESATFTDISFQFTYNFQTEQTSGDTGGNTGTGDEGGETGTGETGSEGVEGTESVSGLSGILSGSGLYIVAGAIVVVILGAFAKFVFKK